MKIPHYITETMVETGASDVSSADKDNCVEIFQSDVLSIEATSRFPGQKKAKHQLKQQLKQEKEKNRESS
jgi:hypothetical protein